MSMENCPICKEDSTPWFHINGHICEACYIGAITRCYESMVWISVKDRLPEHQRIIFVFAKTKNGKNGYGVATFIDSVKMNEELSRTAYSHEQVNVKDHPYYFVSQEVRRHTFNNVSYWMPLPEAPK